MNLAQTKKKPFADIAAKNLADAGFVNLLIC